MCVTSPPYYGLRDYGGEEDQIGQEQSPEEYIQEMVNVFRLVRDVLTDDGDGDLAERVSIIEAVLRKIDVISFEKLAAKERAERG